MKGDLYINNKDAWEEWGINMGDGFIDALELPVSVKETISNESRLEDGKRLIVTEIKKASRSVSLTFTITGSNEEDLRTKKRNFEEALYSGNVSIYIPKNGAEVYHLMYVGSASYGKNVQRTFCKFTVKFEEYNPSKRT